MKLFLSASRQLLKYSYQKVYICHVYFFSASWNKRWKFPLWSTWSCQPSNSLAPGTQVHPLLQWQGFEEALLQVCRCRGIKWLAASKDPTIFQRNTGNTSSLQHSYSLSHVTSNIYCTYFYIFLAIQSHTLILLLIALSVYGVVLPQTSWIPFLISSLSPNFEHPKLKI